MRKETGVKNSNSIFPNGAEFFISAIKLSDLPPKNGSEIKAANISQNYISVYENNLDKIGILKTEDISYIIELYLYFKYLIDSLKWLSERWETYVQYNNDNEDSKDEKIQIELKCKYTDVVNAYKSAKFGEKRILNSFKNVVDRLSKYWLKK